MSINRSTTAHQKTVLGGASVEERAASGRLPALLVRSGDLPRGVEGGRRREQLLRLRF